MDREKLVSSFENYFGKREGLRGYRASGRIEIGGNHTDHQGGAVLAASVDVYINGVFAKNGSDIIRIKSEGYGEIKINISETKAKESEKNSAVALVRGVAAGLKKRGITLGGAEGYVVSEVPKGSGLSSSAAFEVLLAFALCELFGGDLGITELSKISMEAERDFFGKPSGLMDQLACASGGVVAVDFGADEPETEKIDADFKNHDIFIIDTGATHANLTDKYAEIPGEMCAVAGLFGKKRLSEVSEEEFLAKVPEARKTLGDRAVLRALHFFDETKRAKKEAELLKNGEFDAFLREVRRSGRSSFMYLQNIYPSGNVKAQEAAVVLNMCERILGTRGAVRIHGGGFGGTVIAFVPNDLSDSFLKELSRIVGESSIKKMAISKPGATRIF